jgi:hypothetical protein
MVQIRYRVEPDPERPDSGRHYLVREETPFRRPPDRACARSLIFPVTTDCIGLEFSFYNKDTDEWVPTWGDDGRIGLPALIRFSVGVRSPRGQDHWFTTTVAPRGGGS